MSVTGYIRHGYCGALHLIPANDDRMHTIPMCWCPVRLHGKGTIRQFYEHFSVQEIREGKHNRRGNQK